MTERFDTLKEKVREEIGLDEEDIKLLYSLNPENFAEFREKFYAKLANERSVIVFCAA